MTKLPDLHGVVPILLTPFDEDGNLDEKSLRSLTEFTIAEGVHGLGIALGSEVYALSEQERDTMVSTVVDQVAGRIPVVMNTGADTTDVAVRFSQHAADLGVSAVMCTLPAAGLEYDAVLGYFAAIADAVSVPVIVQDTNDRHVPAATLKRLGQDCLGVSYAKVESAPAARRVYEAVQECGDAVSIFGGAGGGAFLQELRRGSVGTMPWPSTPGAFVAVWDHWQAGRRAEAESVFETQIARVLRLSAGGLGMGQAVHKELLRRRGIIASATVRSPDEWPDPITWQEIDEFCTRSN